MLQRSEAPGYTPTQLVCCLQGLLVNNSLLKAFCGRANLLFANCTVAGGCVLQTSLGNVNLPQ